MAKNLSKPNPGNFSFSLDTPSLSSGTLDKYLKGILVDSATGLPEMFRGSEQANGEPREPQINADKSMPNMGNSPSMMSEQHPAILTNVTSEPHELSLTSDNSSALATTGTSNEVIPVPKGQNYVDITDYLNMPQADAAKKLGIPPSTLSKRWKEAVRKRKWPYRMICKIDKEIMTLLHNVPQGPNAPPLPEEIETALGNSLKRRQEELRPVVIRI